MSIFGHLSECLDCLLRSIEEEAPSFLYQPRQASGGGCSLPAANQFQFFTSIETLPPNMFRVRGITYPFTPFKLTRPLRLTLTHASRFTDQDRPKGQVPTHHSGQRLWSENIT